MKNHCILTLKFYQTLWNITILCIFVGKILILLMKKIVTSSDAPAAIGPYSQAVEANNTLYISGQLPINPSVGKIESNNITEQTEQVFKNIEAILLPRATLLPTW